jgi:tetratricopeptide (TPR) repeat protein
MLMVRGKEAFREGNYGRALSLFRSIVERDQTNADAHLWIGYVFEAEGEYTLALRKYEQSLEHERSFTPYEMRMAARYAKARAAHKLEDPELERDTLEGIIEEGRSDGFSEARMRAVIRNMRSLGPDKVLQLYRLREKRIRKAYSLLAQRSLSNGEYERAMDHYTISFTIAMTAALDEMTRLDPDFTFIRRELPVDGDRFFTENTRLFLETAEAEPRIAEYLRSISLYRELFFLAASMYGLDMEEQAQRLWLIVAEHREAGVWSSLAREQAASPDLSVIPAALER